jgi:hypothetical protein
MMVSTNFDEEDYDSMDDEESFLFDENNDRNPLDALDKLQEPHQQN